MSMDKSAVEHIQKTAHLPDVIKQVENTDIPVALVPENMSMKSLEDYMPNASRYRMNFETLSIDDFATYNEQFDQDGATCFIDSEHMIAKTIFDLGKEDAPLHKDHTALIRLKKSAAFRALCSINGDHIRQKQAAEFIEDWADHIAVYTMEGIEMSTAQAAKALCDLTIEAAREVNSKVDDFGEGMSHMERIEAAKKEQLPAEIHFKCTPYNGLEERLFELRVGILTTSDRPQVVLRVLRLEAQEEDMAEEFKDILVHKFSDLKLETYIGSAR